MTPNEVGGFLSLGSVTCVPLQYFDSIDWMTGRASGLIKNLHKFFPVVHFFNCRREAMRQLVNPKLVAYPPPPQLFYSPFFGHHPGEPVPEENFWIYDAREDQQRQIH